MERFICDKENLFTFALSYDLSKKPGGLVCIAPSSMFENANSIDEIDFEKTVWIRVSGSTSAEVKANYEEEKKKFKNRFMTIRENTRKGAV